MDVQISIDFLTHNQMEKNYENQSNYNNNLDLFNRNCRIIFEQLLTGQRLTGMDVVNLGILEYRKRFDDLKKIHGIPVESEYPLKKNGKGRERYKIWWLNKSFINEFLYNR